MTKVKVSVDFIRDAHSAACTEWRFRIEQEFPDLFKSKPFVKGKWYYRPYKSRLVRYSGKFPEPTVMTGMGFFNDDYSGDDTATWGEYPDWSPAPREVVRRAFIEEARKRRYTKDNIIPVRGTYDNTFRPIEIWYYDSDSDELFTAESGGGGIVIYSKGVWAKKRETMTAKEAEKKYGIKIL